MKTNSYACFRAERLMFRAQYNYGKNSITVYVELNIILDYHDILTDVV